MSHPVIPVEGLGETISNTLTGIANTLQQVQQQRQQQQQDAMKALQQVQQQRQQQQQDAMKALLTQATLAHTQAETEHTNTQTAGERQVQRQRDKQLQHATDLQRQISEATGPLMIAIARGKRPGDPEYESAINQAYATKNDEEIFSGIPASEGFPGVRGLRDIVEKTNQMFGAGSTAAEAGTKASVAAAQAPAQKKAAAAENDLLDDSAQARLAAMHSAGTLPVYLEHLRIENERALQNAGADKQGEMLRRQLIINAIDAGQRAWAADVRKGKPPMAEYIDNSLGAITQNFKDENGQPLDPDILRKEAGRMIQGLPVRGTTPAGRPAPAPRPTVAPRIPPPPPAGTDPKVYGEAWGRIERALRAKNPRLTHAEAVRLGQAGKWNIQ